MRSFFFLLLVTLSIVSCTNYGKKVKKGNIEVYYKEGISKEEAEKTAEVLYNSVQGTAGAEGRKSMQLTKGNGDTVHFRMVVDKEKLSMAKDENFLAIATVISDSVFSGKPVNVDLTNTSFKTIRSIAFVKSKALEFGEKITSGNIEVYSDGIDAQLSNDLASFLENYMHPGNTISFQFGKNENGGYMIKMMSNPDKISEIKDEQLNELCAKISEEVLSGSSIIFELTDGQFNSLRTFTYRSTTIEQPDSTLNNEE